MNGPTKIATFSARPDTAFAAVRSAGVWVMLGRITAWTGRVIVKLAEAAVAMTRSGTTGHRAVQGDRGTAECQRLEQVPHEEHAITPEAIAGECGERRNEAGRDELDHREQRRRARATDPVGVHEDRHPGRVLGHVEAEVRELDAGQHRVASHGQDDPKLLPHPAGSMTGAGCKI